MINDLVAKPEVGKTYKGKVVKIMEFGAFVNFSRKTRWISSYFTISN